MSYVFQSYSVGDVLTAAAMNQEEVNIRDHVHGLAGVVSAATLTRKSGSGGGDYSTTSTSYVDVDATNLAYTVTVPTGQKMMIVATGSILTDINALSADIALTDGTTLLQEVKVSFAASSGTARYGFALTYIFVGAGASSTFKLRFRTNSAGTATIANGSSTLTPQMVFWLG